MGRSVSTPQASALVCYAHSAHEDGDDFEISVEDFQQQMKAAFPSLDSCNRWIGREDRAVLENGYAYFGVSEYMGLVAMWVCPKESPDWASEQFTGRRDHWIAQIGTRFELVADRCFGERLYRLGVMSNGVGVFARA